MRVLLALFLAAPLSAQAFGVSSSAERRARAILERQAPCLGCHVINGEGGRVGPSLDYIGQRRNADYIRAMISDPQSVVMGSAMPKPLLPPADLERIIRYIAQYAPPGLRPNPVTRGPHAPPISPPMLYRRWCASCHGPTGRGDGPNARFLPVKPATHADASAMSLRPDDSLFDAIAGGGVVMGKSPRMPGFGATLTDAEIRSLVRYIRELCRCEGPAWSRDGRPTQ